MDDRWFTALVYSTADISAAVSEMVDVPNLPGLSDEHRNRLITLFEVACLTCISGS